MPEEAATPDSMRRKAMDLIPGLVRLDGARIVDVGCGDGALVRALAKRGAHVTGVEVQDPALDKARGATPVADEQYLKGAGEALPLPDGCADVVIFMNSLHHVPQADMGKALEEAARVLVPGGMVLVNEPEATGDYFKLTKLLDDETEVRLAAYAAIKAVRVLEPVEEVFYLNPVKHDDFQSFTDRMVGIDPTRRSLLQQRDEELRALFEQVGERRDGAIWFDQPARINLLRKPMP